ncbi:Alpha/Beta hydrolase protein [Dimargaris cristalligena]|uniref:Carboxypeptidase n=1 Tax=Dimargaris cristalligena TaxID=215637 RepID=A0A4Q0A1F7_9FUNG|nr:Alpha/Beta hydrolase protein [Dimargaris cristalligena]|eukprot:RKP39608.1 Alpha/Beta hydrolase protein [Dimargaris cristalligena]
MVAEHTAFPQYKLRVRQPKLCDPTVKQYSGYLDVDSDKHFYFWFFESRDRPAEDPVLLWLNGGPGCSSMTGLLMELGPCRVNAKGDGVVNNPHSWNNHANLIFLDQPVNVGYSYGRGVFNTVSASEDVYAFLQLFFQQFNQYASLPFHVFGESYGGHYVPAIGSKIFRENRQLLDTSSLVGQFWKGKGVQVINLDSLGIGNGLVDELVQYKYYHKMACDSSYGSVLSESACRRMENAYPACAEKIEKCYRYENALSCVPASFTCNRGIIGPYQESGLNPYDVREPCESGGLCYPIIGAIEKYLNRPEVKAELGADVEKYQGCNMNVNMGFNLAGDWMKPYMRYLPELLESGIRILVYAGDADFICNWYGNKAWTIELSWAGQKQFAAAKDRAWTMKPTEDLQVGEVRSHENFTFLRVFGAGHMVPYDQPESSADMIERWLSKRDF